MSKGEKQEMTTLKVTREVAAKVSFTVKMLRRDPKKSKLTASQLIDELLSNLYKEAIEAAGGVEIKPNDEETENE